MGRALKKDAGRGMKDDGQRRTAADGLSRLPRAVREKISLAIEDGCTWKTVAMIAEKAGLRGVTAQNVTNFRKGAHKEWLARQERMDAIRRDSERTAALMAHYVAHGGSPAEAGLLAASEIMSQALAGMGPESLKIMMAENPKALFAVTRELTRVATLIAQKQVAAAAAPVVADAGPEMSEEEQQAKIVAAVDAALGIKSK